MEYNMQVRADALRDVAVSFGLNVWGLDDLEAAKMAVRATANLIKNVELPISLKEMGIPREAVPELANVLVSKYQRLLNNNPCEVTYEDANRIFMRMWEGRLESLGG
jgi:alcohol dehydrogenase class IV